MELNACPVQEATSLLLEVEVYGSSSSYGAHMMWLITAKRLLLPRRPHQPFYSELKLNCKPSEVEEGSCFPFLHFAKTTTAMATTFFQLMKKALSNSKNRLLCRAITLFFVALIWTWWIWFLNTCSCCDNRIVIIKVGNNLYVKEKQIRLRQRGSLALISWRKSSIDAW